MRIIHCRNRFRNTGKLPRSLRPSAVTSSLASTVPRPGHQFTMESARYTIRLAVDDVGPLPRRQRGPVPPVLEMACTGIVFGDQLGDRARLVGRGVEPGVVDLQEDPLGPLVELDIGGREASSAVVAETQPAQLAAEVFDVGLGPGARVGAGLHGVLLGGQPEGVEPQRVQHITAVHPVVARVDVGGDVAQRVPDVESVAGWIGEHVLHEQLVGGHRGAIRREPGRRPGWAH